MFFLVVFPRGNFRIPKTFQLFGAVEMMVQLGTLLLHRQRLSLNCQHPHKKLGPPHHWVWGRDRWVPGEPWPPRLAKLTLLGYVEDLSQNVSGEPTRKTDVQPVTCTHAGIYT